MDETERITDPSMGSNELGSETREEVHTGVSAGTDTQLFLAAAGGKKHKKNKANDAKKTNEDHTNESQIEDDDTEFLEVDETDE
ncbi:MAG: hypothetical protein ACTHK0_01145 [Ginsengibacter sp.]